MPTLHDLLEGVELGTPATWGNLQLIPLRRNGGRTPVLDYLLAEEAFKRGLLKVTEVSEGARVSQLLAINNAHLPILFLDGEELIGAMQNRILNTDVLMRPHTQKAIPVSCVEEGRWRRTRTDFEPGSYSPPPMRARKSSSVSLSLEETGMACSDQSIVWDEVDSMLSCTGTSSGTSAMADAFEQRREDLNSYVTELSCPHDAIGVVALAHGQFRALDLFDRPSTLQRVWPRLVVGYAIDAVAAADPATANQTRINASGLLDCLRPTECAARGGVDLGEDWRFDSNDIVGSALVAQGTALHLSAFPALR
jgi:hypothetical protein